MSLWHRLLAWRRRTGEPLDLAGERAAADHLRRRGYRILASRDRSMLGEIDLVAVDGKTLVFVEVKTREGGDAGHPSEAVDLAKQRRITRAALAYMKRRKLLDAPARFDVVAVTWPAGQRQPRIEHIENAFEAVGD